ncbi:MAG: hypothetical protein ACFE9A_20580 [Candidatus Hodarchaeota archaeon]
MIYSSMFEKNMILDSLKLILTKYKSVRELYNAIALFFKKDQEKEFFSYSQFTRYIKGEILIPEKNADILTRFLHNNFNITTDLVQPNLIINVNASPIQVDMSTLLSSPKKVNLLAFHLIRQDHLKGKFDVILTHSEAIPLAIAFSQVLNIPWWSVSFRSPSVHPSLISQYPYLIDQELVATAYFIQGQNIQNKKVFVINDYIRRGGFLDILFRVVEDNSAEVHFLLTILGIGNTWKRFYNELEGNMRVVHFL